MASRWSFPCGRGLRLRTPLTSSMLRRLTSTPSMNLSSLHLINVSSSTSCSRNGQWCGYLYFLQLQRQDLWEWHRSAEAADTSLHGQMSGREPGHQSGVRPLDHPALQTKPRLQHLRMGTNCKCVTFMSPSVGRRDLFLVWHLCCCVCFSWASVSGVALGQRVAHRPMWEVLQGSLQTRHDVCRWVWPPQPVV